MSLNISITLRELKESFSGFMSELIFHLRSALILSLEGIKLRLAIYLADIKQKVKNHRFFVVLMTVGYTADGSPITRLRSIDNDGFKYCKRMGWLPKRMDYLELRRRCFYSTPISRNNSGTKEDRIKAKEKYIRYQKAINRIKL